MTRWERLLNIRGLGVECAVVTPLPPISNTTEWLQRSLNTRLTPRELYEKQDLFSIYAHGAPGYIYRDPDSIFFGRDIRDRHAPACSCTAIFIGTKTISVVGFFYMIHDEHCMHVASNLVSPNICTSLPVTGNRMRSCYRYLLSTHYIYHACTYNSSFGDGDRVWPKPGLLAAG